MKSRGCLWLSRRRRTVAAVTGAVTLVLGIALLGPLSLRSTAESAKGPAPAKPTPTVTPFPTAAPSRGAEASPTATPSPTLGAEWAPLLDQEFSRPAAAGQFSTLYPGWADYDSYRDTAKLGIYDSRKVVTVADGVLNEHLHSVAGQPYVVSITPVPHVQTYGRYEVRFRAGVAPGYKIAWLLWPADDRFGTGEIDFPEASLADGNQVLGFAHQINGDGRINQWAVDTGSSPQAWHTAVIEWRPRSLTFILDGASWTTTDPRAIPTVPMYWSLQTETYGHPAPATTGNVQIDYLKAWKYVPGAGG